jgi:hypothetical protein
MAVTVIDAAGELAQVQADLDAQQALQDGKLPERAEAAPAKEAEAKPAAEKPGEAADPEEVEGEDGLTSRERHDLLAVGRKDLPESVKRVIGKRVAQRKAAEEFAAAQYNERKLAEQRASALDAELAALKAKAAPPEQLAPETGKPQRDKFDSDEKFWEAMTDWRIAEALAKKAADDAKAAADRHQAGVTAAAKVRFDAAAKAIPDFEETVRSVGDTRLHEAVLGYMEQSDLMPEMLYFLAKNPDRLAALAKQPPAGQLVTIGKIESSLKPFEAKPAVPKDSNGATPSSKSTNGARFEAAPSDDTGVSPGRARDAAPVIRPLNGSGASPAEIDPRDMNIRETIHDWEKRNNAHLTLRKRH